MENISKALLIAAGVLIGILVLTIAVYLFINFGKTSREYAEKLNKIEIQKYNGNFDKFIGRDDITAQEIVTTISIIQQKEMGTKIYIDKVDCTNWTEEQKSEFLTNSILIKKDDNTLENSYSYDLNFYPIEYDEIGIITRISFIKN